MAQYNLLGGVNPINPEYDIQNSMRGKGINWAEYGLRKEQLKEQKKQNRISNVMQGINTAMNVLNTGLEFKNNELKRESQELINTERALDIQSKRIDINNKQKEADEDTKFADGLMSLLEAKEYEKIGPYIYGTNPKILQRNEGVTWSGIQSVRNQFGDDPADKLLSWALPTRAQEMQKSINALSVAKYNYQGKLVDYQGKIAEVQGKLQQEQMKNRREKIKTQREMLNNFFGGISGGISGGTGGVEAGFVDKQQNNIYNNNQKSLNDLLALSGDNIDLYNILNEYGLINGNVLDQRKMRSYIKEGDFEVTAVPVKEDIEKLQSILGKQSITEFLNLTGGRLPASFEANLTPGGQPVLDMSTKNPTVNGGDFFSPEETSRILKSYNDNDGANIILVKRKGQLVKAFPASVNETKVIKNAYDTTRDLVNTISNNEQEAFRQMDAKIAAAEASGLVNRRQAKRLRKSVGTYMSKKSPFDSYDQDTSKTPSYERHQTDRALTAYELANKDFDAGIANYYRGSGLVGKPEEFVNADLYNKLVRPKEPLTTKKLLEDSKLRKVAYEKVKSILTEQFRNNQERYNNINTQEYKDKLEEGSIKANISTIGSSLHSAVHKARLDLQDNLKGKIPNRFLELLNPSKGIPTAISKVPGGKYALRRWFSSYGDLPEYIKKPMNNIDTFLDNKLSLSLNDKTERALKTALNKIADELNEYYTKNNIEGHLSRINFRALTEDTARIKDVFKDWIEYLLLEEVKESMEKGDNTDVYNTRSSTEELDILLKGIDKYLLGKPIKK